MSNIYQRCDCCAAQGEKGELARVKAVLCNECANAAVQFVDNCNASMEIVDLECEIVQLQRVWHRALGDAFDAVVIRHKAATRQFRAAQIKLQRELLAWIKDRKQQLTGPLMEKQP